MYQTMSNLKEVLRDLHPMYQDQIKQAGPLLGALNIDAYIYRIPSPPAPSPVAAHLREIRYRIWVDIRKHLNKLRRDGIRILGRAEYDQWASQIVSLASDRDQLAAYTVALFVEGQAVTVAGSPHQALDTLLTLLEPVVESNGALSFRAAPEPPSPEPANVSITVCLHAGRVPFALTCHSKTTLSRWSDELEAATVLLIPQVIVHVDSRVSRQASTLMRSAIESEIRAWAASRPMPGEQKDWEWLPRLM